MERLIVKVFFYILLNKRKELVNKANSILIYFIVFIFGAVILRLSGLISVTSIELLAYIFMFSGVGVVYASFGTERKGLLFIGSSVFLVGIIVFVTSKFELENARQIIFPSVLFISGIGFLLLYLDSLSQKLYLIISLFFLAGGLLYIFIFRDFALSGLAESMWSMIKSYWVVLLIVAGLIFILRKEV